MPSFNSPDVVAQVEQLHDAYERALIAHDVAALDGYFWDSPDVVRYGVSEHLYGADAVAEYRRSGGPTLTDRRLVRRKVVAIGENVASVMCEFHQKVFGQARHSRQSQVWVRLDGAGWKIVAAHVSNALVGPPQSGSLETFADQAAAVLGVPLAAAHRPGVVQNLERAAAIAAPLLKLPLTADAEVASVFVP